MDASEEYVDDPLGDQCPEEGPTCSTSNGKRKSEEPETSGKKPKTKQEDNKKTFQHKWLEMAQFQGWLEAVPGNKNSAKCGCCGVFLSCGKSDLDKHAKTAKHVANVKMVKQVKPINELLARKSAGQLHQENVRSMEVQLAAYFAEHNVAFSQSDHLVKVIQKGAKDSSITKDVTLGQDKCKAVVKNVIAQAETDELDEILKDILFSVMIDESTDISNKKNMCILVRFVSPKTRRPVTQLLEMVPLDAHDTGADALWKAFTDCLDRHGLPLRNIVGLACDNANVMTGIRASFWTKLKAACPWAVLLNCICHTSAIISRSACSMLPSFVEYHLRSISTYMNCSPKRCAELVDFQELYEEEIQKILKFSTTRWLVMHPCVQRYIQHRESLLVFFRTAVRENPKDREAANILQDMNNTLAYMLFLEYGLEFFNQFNALFQSGDILIHKLSDASQKLLNRFCQTFIVRDELKCLDATNLSHPSNFRPLENIYVGPKCAEYLEKLQLPTDRKTKEEAQKELRELKNAFLLKCLAFYSKGATEMKARLPTGKIFKEMSFLDPTVLLSPDVREELPDLNVLASNFQERLELDLNALAIEWRSIVDEIDDGPLKKRLLTMPVEEAWIEIGDLKNFSGQKMFPELTKLANCVMSLPHSNADAERAFSMVTDVKTKKRNRMGADTLNAICVVRSAFARKGVTCVSFDVTAAHLKKFDVGIYRS